MKKALISFPKGDIIVKLLNTPATEVWISSLKDYNAQNLKMYTQIGKLLSRSSNLYLTRDIEFEEKCVKEINTAIDEFNLVTTGKKFEYRAFVDMPWEQTNKIHRCFTLGSSSVTPLGKDTYGGILKHTLSVKQLKKYKEVYAYDNKRKFLDYTAFQYYYEAKHSKTVHSALHRINKWVHLYENKRHSAVATSFFSKYEEASIENPDTKFPFQINIGWDIFTPDGDKTYNNNRKLTSQEVNNSLPDDWMDCDVFLIKSITGKDYETCFLNYDDPREYDIQNAQYVNGAIRIFPNGGHREVYGKDLLGGWAESYGIKPQQYAPIPIGKIISADFALTEVESDPTSIDTNGAPSSTPPYRNPSIKILE